MQAEQEGQVDPGAVQLEHRNAVAPVREGTDADAHEHVEGGVFPDVVRRQVRLSHVSKALQDGRDPDLDDEVPREPQQQYQAHAHVQAHVEKLETGGGPRVT